VVYRTGRVRFKKERKTKKKGGEGGGRKKGAVGGVCVPGER